MESVVPKCRLGWLCLVLAVLVFGTGVAHGFSDDDSGGDSGPTARVSTAPTVIVAPSGNSGAAAGPAISPAAAAQPLTVAPSGVNDAQFGARSNWSDISRSALFGWATKDGFLLIFDGLLVLFALRLVKIGRTQAKVLEQVQKMSGDMTAAANRSAEAAERSAEAVKISTAATKGALNIDRPFLIADGLTFHDEELQRQAKQVRDKAAGEPASSKASRPVAIQVSFSVTNYGKGPAVIDSIVGRVTVVDSLTTLPPDDYSGCVEWIRKKRVLGVAANQMAYSPIAAPTADGTGSQYGWLTSEQIQAVLDEKAFLVAYGRISYRDYLMSTSYSSDFFWLYSAIPLRADQKGLALPGPEDRNRYL